MRRIISSLMTFIAVALLIVAPVTDAGVAAGRADGSVRALDPTFGVEGVVVTDLGQDAVGSAVATGAKIVVAGTITGESGLPDVFLARYLRNGTIDSTFGNEGLVVADIGGYDRPIDIRITDDDAIVALSSIGTDQDTRGIALARFGPDGTLDGSFGDAGVVQVAADLYGNALALQPDGKILVTATGSAAGATMLRFTGDGQPDPDFGVDGRVDTSFGTPNDWPAGLNLMPDGKLLLVASSSLCDEDFYCDTHIVLVRYLSDGSIDSSYGTDGIARKHIDDWAYVMGGGVDTAGNVLVLVSQSAGSHYCGRHAGELLMRFAPDGTFDHSYGVKGRAHIKAFEVRGVGVRPDGGAFVMGDACANPPSLAYAVGTARLLPDGSFDPAFGEDGVSVDRIGRALDLALQTNGRAVVVGSARHALGIMLARYLAN